MMKFGRESKRTLSCIALTLLGLVLHTSPVAAATYTAIIVPGSIQTSANGINNSNQVVGVYELPDTSTEGFLLSNGTYTTVKFPGTMNNAATGINDSGVMVGYYISNNIGHKDNGWIDQNGTFTPINYPLATSTQPLGINNAGLVVGTYVDGRLVSHGFEYNSGIYKAINISNAKDTLVAGINNLGDISGSYVDQSGHEHGFLLRSNGTLVTVSNPGGANATVGGGLNDNDQVVGYYTPTGANFSRGYEWSSGKFANILYPLASSTFPSAINNTQLVVGEWIGANGAEGFLETP